ncbi:hypothetical protein BH11PLA2_BH11PLA2_04190 [soil metagenome]
MTDARFQSVHLEGQPRRELFRQARSQISASCGQHTIAGDLRELIAEAGPNGPTKMLPPPNPNALYFLKDGETLHKLVVGVNSVGRLPDNQVVLADDHVSRRHCAVVIHSDGRCELHDVASKNGTLINGKKITGPTPMVTGDQISLCGKMLELVEGK